MSRDGDAETQNDGRPAERMPSWFDSEFMTEEEVAPSDDEPLAGHAGNATASAASAEGNSLGDDDASSTASSDDSSAAELRLKLAEMFDLPDLPERAGSTIHEPEEEPSADATGNDSSDGTSDITGNGLSSQWPEPAAVDSSAETLLFSENDTVENFADRFVAITGAAHDDGRLGGYDLLDTGDAHRPECLCPCGGRLDGVGQPRIGSVGPSSHRRVSARGRRGRCARGA